MAAVALAVTGCRGAADAPVAEAGPGFDFAVMGDTPYSPEGERLFPILSEEISRSEVAFVVHIGDVKGSWTACTDSVLALRMAQLDSIAHPVVYVPGDNEWTDCHRNPERDDLPLERLAFLRSVAYPEPGGTLGSPGMPVDAQVDEGGAGFPEHQRWSHQGVVFATVHAVGSRNGLDPFEGRTAEDDAEVEARIAASVTWIRETFALARERQAVAVVIATQADPWFFPPDFTGRTGFEEILSTLADEAEAWERPVLLIHGDSHTLRFDRPFWSEENPVLPNLMRLETYGNPDVGWVRVHVDPTSRSVFGFTPRPVPPMNQ